MSSVSLLESKLAWSLKPSIIIGCVRVGRLISGFSEVETLLLWACSSRVYGRVLVRFVTVLGFVMITMCDLDSVMAKLITCKWLLEM